MWIADSAKVVAEDNDFLHGFLCFGRIGHNQAIGMDDAVL